ncbi:hypothetical protein BH24CHL9_BH24CHL9_08660 [soil metagenome]
MTVIDPQAPVVARAEVEVRASPPQVWSVLADIAEWPTWNPVVRSVTLQGELESGTTFRRAAGQGTILGRLLEVDAPRALVWRDRSLGLRAIHAWRIEERPGGCAVTTEASLSGLPARLLPGRMRRLTQQDLEAWVHLLKLEVEVRAADSGPADSGPAEEGDAGASAT